MFVIVLGCTETTEGELASHDQLALGSQPGAHQATLGFLQLAAGRVMKQLQSNLLESRGLPHC